MCTILLLPGVNLIAVKKCITYHIHGIFFKVNNSTPCTTCG